MINLAVILVAAALSPSSKPAAETWLFGSANGADLFVEIKPVPFDETNHIRTVEIHAVFTAIRRNKVVQRTERDLGQAFGGPTALVIGGFLGEDREQVFISLTMGAVRSWVFDYDGKKLKTVYERTKGRVATSVSPSANGGWQIDEHWPKQQFEDVFNGQPEHVRPDGYILRSVPLIRGH